MTDGNNINVLNNTIRSINSETLSPIAIGCTDNSSLLNISNNLITYFLTGIDVIANKVNIQGNNISNCSASCIKTNSSTNLNISNNIFSDSKRDILFTANTSGVACFNNLSTSIEIHLSNKEKVTNFNESNNVLL